MKEPEKNAPLAAETSSLQLSGAETVRAKTNHVSCALGEETVILELKGGTYFGLNEVGTRVWNILQEQPTTVAEIQQTLISSYEVDPKLCMNDLSQLLEDMQQANLIEIQR